jgi:hypothetical protein
LNYIQSLEDETAETDKNPIQKPCAAPEIEKSKARSVSHPGSRFSKKFKKLGYLIDDSQRSQVDVTEACWVRNLLAGSEFAQLLETFLAVKVRGSKMLLE